MSRTAKVAVTVAAVVIGLTTTVGVAAAADDTNQTCAASLGCAGNIIHADNMVHLENLVHLFG